jgi:hypothetical protein
MIEDKKRQFRYTQIENEGNDPQESNQAYGTPHQIASLYGGNSNRTAASNVPLGYNELDPSEPIPVQAVLNLKLHLLVLQKIH